MISPNHNSTSLCNFRFLVIEILKLAKTLASGFPEPKQDSVSSGYTPPPSARSRRDISETQFPVPFGQPCPKSCFLPFKPIVCQEELRSETRITKLDLPKFRRQQRVAQS